MEGGVLPARRILHLVLEAFKGYNHGWLGRVANLVEANRATGQGGGDFLLVQCSQGAMQWRASLAALK